MIYLISGNETVLIDSKINEIISKNKDYELVRIDGSDKNFTVKDFLNVLNDVGLFATGKIILVKDPFFLIKKCDDKDATDLLKYVNSPVYENELVLYTLEDKFNERLKLFKDISKNAQTFKLNQFKKQDFYNECLVLYKKRNIKMSRDTFNSLVNACNNSLTIFKQNLDVLELYPEEITNDVLKGLLISSDDEDVFGLINAIIAKNLQKALTLIDKILLKENNINGLIALLANQLRFLYEVSYYDANGDNVNVIMDKTGAKNRYRIEKAFESLGKLKQFEIIALLSKLSDIDYQIKTSSELDQRLLFEMFIVKMIKNEKN